MFFSMCICPRSRQLLTYLVNMNMHDINFPGIRWEPPTVTSLDLGKAQPDILACPLGHEPEFRSPPWHTLACEFHGARR